MKSEYRVVGDPKLGNTPEIIKTQCEFGEAEHYRDLYRGDSAFTNVRIQSRLVPPWIDLHTPPEEREGQVTLNREEVQLVVDNLHMPPRRGLPEARKVRELWDRLNSTTHNPEEGC